MRPYVQAASARIQRRLLFGNAGAFGVYVWAGEGVLGTFLLDSACRAVGCVCDACVCAVPVPPVVVYDVCSRSSFDTVARWVDEVRVHRLHPHNNQHEMTTRGCAL